MGVGSSSTANDFVHGGVNRFMTGTMGIGGAGIQNKLVDPLGLFSSDKKKAPVTGTDAQGNPLIRGKPYDPNKIYSNPANAEAARQIAIKQGSAAVNNIFDSPERAAQHEEFLKALREFYTADANKQKGIADRTLKFSMARNGLTGGSASVDANRTLGEEYQKGLLDAENKAQGAYSDLQGQDENTRMSLLSAVRSGLDATTAAQRAGAQMQSNAASAQSQSMAQGLGDIFGQTATTYKAGQDAAAKRRGILDAYGSFYGAKNPYG